MIPKIDSSNFTWELWESSSIFKLFGFHFRYNELLRYKQILRQYAIGYCAGENLIVRPKTEETAVMYEKDGVVFWSHLTNEEFKEIFTEG